MPYVEVAGDNIFYAWHANNAGGRVPLVLVHGAGENHLAWPAALRRMTGIAVYALDLPGHGKSSGDGRSTITEYADFLAQWLDALKIDRAVLAGHSMGGAIAQQFALAYPHRSTALILIATGARLRVAPQILDLARSDLPAAADWITEYEWGPDTPEQMKQLGKQQLLANRPDVIYGDYVACNAFDVIDRLGDIRAPALVVGGTADRMTPPKYASFLAERIPHARLALIEGAGHMVMLEREREVALPIEQFLRDQVVL